MRCMACNHEKSDDLCLICFVPDKIAYNTRWKLSRLLVIGANYDADDFAFWHKWDENYIAIGEGSDIWHWQQNWNQDQFWNFANIPVEHVFDRIVLDRCVWNIFVQNLPLFDLMIDFVIHVLRKGGSFLIPINHWYDAEHQFMRSTFAKNVEGFQHPMHCTADKQALEIILSKNRFLPCACLFECDFGDQDRKQFKVLFRAA